MNYPLGSSPPGGEMIAISLLLQMMKVWLRQGATPSRSRGQEIAELGLERGLDSTTCAFPTRPRKGCVQYFVAVWLIPP